MDTGKSLAPLASINLRRFSAGQALESWGRKTSKINPKISTADIEVVSNRSLGPVILLAKTRVAMHSRLIKIAGVVITPLDQRESAGTVIAMARPEAIHVAMPIFCGHFEIETQGFSCLPDSTMPIPARRHKLGINGST